MCDEHAVRQRLAKLRMRTAVHNAMNDAMHVRARVHVVRNARAMIESMLPVRSAPSSSHVKIQLPLPRTRRLSSR